MTRVRAWAVALAALLAGFGLVLAAVQTRWAPVHRLDARVARDLHHLAVQHPLVVSCSKWTSVVLHPDVLRAVAAIAAVALWIRRRRAAAVFVVVAMAGAAGLESGIKVLVDRSRPVWAHPVAHAAGAAFPSGHAMTATVAFGVLVTFTPARRRGAAGVVGVVAVLAVALVSASRLLLGVHYLTDVVGGWLLGCAWLVAVAAAHTRQRPVTSSSRATSTGSASR